MTDADDDDDLKVERVEVKDVRVPEQLIQASSVLFQIYRLISFGLFNLLKIFKLPCMRR